MSLLIINFRATLKPQINIATSSSCCRAYQSVWVRTDAVSADFGWSLRTIDIHIRIRIDSNLCCLKSPQPLVSTFGNSVIVASTQCVVWLVEIADFQMYTINSLVRPNNYCPSAESKKKRSKMKINWADRVAVRLPCCHSRSLGYSCCSLAFCTFSWWCI